MSTSDVIDIEMPVTDQTLAAAILSGFGSMPKRIESKWLYDAPGSKLFDQITELPEYYQTRTEIEILRKNADALAAQIPAGAALIELGSGSSIKTRILLDALPTLASYVPVDISDEHLQEAAGRITADYPDLEVLPIVADFTVPLALPTSLENTPKLVFFPGSTIGNFEPHQAAALMVHPAQWREVIAFVIGTDLKKNTATLIRAYDDSAGVTAAFNLNLLTRLNRELGANFDLDSFVHEARWNETLSRIEMHLVSLRDQSVDIAGKRFGFAEGETIHTENSHKYDIEAFRRLAASAGWSPIDVWTDERELFAVHIMHPSEPA